VPDALIAQFVAYPASRSWTAAEGDRVVVNGQYKGKPSTQVVESGHTVKPARAASTGDWR
jgi:hypothetical protein